MRYRDDIDAERIRVLIFNTCLKGFMLYHMNSNLEDSDKKAHTETIQQNLKDVVGITEGSYTMDFYCEVPDWDTMQVVCSIGFLREEDKTTNLFPITQYSFRIEFPEDIVTLE